ncbi:MAG TPA: hypothetical protein VGQ65_22600 [Thermoanaerobaculia bacterium]|nr:hypothetical protein [Thermoanaerobaculia bacterium]
MSQTSNGVKSAISDLPPLLLALEDSGDDTNEGIRNQLLRFVEKPVANFVRQVVEVCLRRRLLPAWTVIRKRLVRVALSAMKKISESAVSR